MLREVDVHLPNGKRATADTVVVRPGSLRSESGKGFVRYGEKYLDHHDIVWAIESKSGRADISDYEKNFIDFMAEMGLSSRHSIGRVSASKVDPDLLFEMIANSTLLRRLRLTPDRERFTALYRKYADKLPVILFLSLAPQFVVDDSSGE